MVLLQFKETVRKRLKGHKCVEKSEKSEKGRQGEKD